MSTLIIAPSDSVVFGGMLDAMRETDDLEQEDSTFLRPTFRVPAPSDSTFALHVVEGPDAGRIFTVDDGEVVFLGQSAVSTARLSDPQVSRRHAQLAVVGDTLRINDLGSKNGTYANGVAITEASLRGGEVVCVGSTMLRVERRQAVPRELPIASSFGGVIGASIEMRRVYPICARLAASTVPVVIEGETGTGKEVLAEALHEAGPRASNPFVVFDCTAVAPSLMEAELFGHERGAFTGAVAPRRGVFEQADGGTLLIDEIGDLDLALQPKLLRAVERGEIRRVGGERRIRVDVRVLAATRRDLDRAVQDGTFRDDLFHRLAIGRIELPPLRHRRGDVSLLARHFWMSLGGEPDRLTPALIARFEQHSWPGNVRELRNTVARLLALGDLAERTDTPDEAAAVVEPRQQESLFDRVLAMRLPLLRAREVVVDAFEQRYLAKVLEENDDNVTRAAKASGIARRHFYRLRERRSI